MKKICGIIFLLIFLLLSSCSVPNMQTLLAYQNKNMEFRLRIQDGETFMARLSVKDGEFLLTFEDEARKNISYRQNKEGVISILFQDKEIVMENSHLLKCKAWFSLFRLSPEQQLWKIKKENPGGIGVFVCRSDGLTVYIDAASGTPLKWKSGTLEIDVLSASANK